MSKKSTKVNTIPEEAATQPTAATTATAVLNTAEELQGLLEHYENSSLRKLALACELSYGWILKQSKKPIEGVPYDPNGINYQAVADVFNKKGIDLKELDWNAMNEATVRNNSLLVKNMNLFNVGQKVYLREDNEVPFLICYKTDTHIVLIKDGSTEPRSWSYATFLMKGPVFEPRTKSNKTNAEEEA